MLTVDKKIYAWHELVKEFPNKWIVVENAEFKPLEIFVKANVYKNACV